MTQHRFLLSILAFAFLLPSLLSAAEKDRPDFIAVFRQDAVATYHLHIPMENYLVLLSAPHARKYVRATLIYSYGGKKEKFPDVGVRFKGNFSLEFARKKRPFKIDFDRFKKDQTFHGLRKINLHNNLMNPTQIRERLSYDLFRKAGVPCPRCTHVRLVLTVPGIYSGTYMGVFSLVEQIDKTFLKDRFGDGSGTLVKAKDYSDLTWKGGNLETYDRYWELKTNKKKIRVDGLLRFLRVLNRTPDADFQGAIEKVLNVDTFLAFLAVNTILSNFDAYPAMARNYYLYDNPANGKIEFIPWDMNASFGIAAKFFGLDPSVMYTYDIYNPHFSRRRPLVTRILNVPAFRKRYEKKLRKILDTHFTVEAMVAAIDRLASTIRKAVHEDSRKGFPNEIFEQSLLRDVTVTVEDIPGIGKYTVPGLKSFIGPRRQCIQKQLDAARGKRGR